MIDVMIFSSVAPNGSEAKITLKRVAKIHNDAIFFTLLSGLSWSLVDFITQLRAIITQVACVTKLFRATCPRSSAFRLGQVYVR